MFLRSRILEVVSCVILSSLLIGCSSNAKPYSQLEVGQKAPATKFQLTNGDFSLVEDLRGKKTGIYLFWAQWCSRSRTQIHELELLARRLNGRSDVEIVAASVDDVSNFEKVQQRIKELDLRTLKIAFSGNEGNDEAYASFQGEGVPVFFVVNRQLEIVLVTQDVREVETLLKKEGYLQ